MFKYIVASVLVVFATVFMTSYVTVNVLSAKDNSEYDKLLQKYNELQTSISPKQAASNGAEYFSAQADDAIIWQTNGIFILHDLKIKSVKYGFFSDTAEVKVMLSSKSLKPNEAIYLNAPDCLQPSEGELLTFNFRGINYAVFVCNGHTTWGYDIMGGKIPITNGKQVDLVEENYLNCHRMRHYCMFWRREFYSKIVFLSKGMLSATEWMSVENSNGKTKISFHVMKGANE